MQRGSFQDAGERSPEELTAAYCSLLAETIADVGVDAAADRSEIDVETIRRILDGDPVELRLSEAAAILAADPAQPDADEIAAEARDLLLMSMTTAVMDVEKLASAIDGALEPRVIQHMVEGRHPMTLREYALLHQRLAAETA